MKNKIFLLLFVTFLTFFFYFCGKHYDNVASTLDFFPYNSTSYIVLDIKKASKEGFRKEIFEFIGKFFGFKSEKDINKFLSKMGIETEKSINYIVLGGTGNGKGIIWGVEHDTEKFLKYLRDSKIKCEKDNYKGKKIYIINGLFDNFCESEKLELVSLNKYVLITGDPNFIKSIIDVFEGSKRSIKNNNKIMNILLRVKTDSVFWGIIDYKKEINQLIGGKAKEFGLEGKDFSLMIFYFDFEKKVLDGRIKIISKNSEENERTVAILNGLKAVFSAGNSKISKIIKHIKFKAEKDEISIEISIPQNIIKKERIYLFIKK